MVQTLQSTKNDKWLICLKHGDKYDSQYVNKLYSMFERNSSGIRFACYTENTQGINSNIECFPLPNLDLSGWWFKPALLNPNLPTQGTNLFVDLDVVIFNNINKFFDFSPSKFCIIQDFHRQLIPTWQKFNSSVFRFDTGTMNNAYTHFVSNYKVISSKFKGDQDFLSCFVNDYKFWPTEWAMSYKWEMRQRAKIISTKYGKDFETAKDPLINNETAIAVFHGEPNPSYCKDQWVKENWA